MNAYRRRCYTRDEIGQRHHSRTFIGSAEARFNMLAFAGRLTRELRHPDEPIMATRKSIIRRYIAEARNCARPNLP